MVAVYKNIPIGDLAEYSSFSNPFQFRFPDYIDVTIPNPYSNYSSITIGLAKIIGTEGTVVIANIAIYEDLVDNHYGLYPVLVARVRDAEESGCIAEALSIRIKGKSDFVGVSKFSELPCEIVENPV